MQRKTCRDCGKEKPLVAFYADKRGKFGRRSRCVPCYAADTQLRRYANLDAARQRERAAAAKWRHRHQAAVRPSNNARQQERMRRLTHRVHAALGGRCDRCPVTDSRILHIDHKNDDGAVQRKAFASRESFLNFVLAKPNEFQLLCPNCNHRKRLAASRGPGTRQSAYTLKHVAKLRMTALTTLGDRCRCGETDAVVLCIDHVRGGGRQDRLALGGSAAMYRDVPVNPAKYQILCHNCNWLKRHEVGEWGNYLAQ